MKFVCDRCQTRYSIADEKIRQRIVRIRCKNCGGVITLHAGEVVPGPQDAAARLSSDLPVVPAAGRASSRLSRPPVPRSEWFVAVDGAEKGPLSCSEAAKYIASLGPDQVVHVWKEGMDDWKRPKDVAILSQELSSLKRSPGAAPVDARTVGSTDATVVTPPPVAFNPRPRPAPPAASGSAPKLPGLSARVSAPGSAPKSAPPPVPASHRAPPPIPGAARLTPKAPATAVPDARLAAKSSTLAVIKTPPPATVRAPKVAEATIKTPLPATVRQSKAVEAVIKTPPPATVRQSKAMEAVIKTPPPATVRQSKAMEAVIKTPLPATVRQSKAVEAVIKTPLPATVRQSKAMEAVIKTPPPATVRQSKAMEAVIKTPPPATVRQSKAMEAVIKTPLPATVFPPKTEAELEPAPGAGVHTPGAKFEFDDDVPTSPDARRRASLVAKSVPGPESTPAIQNTPGVQDFSRADRTPPPVQPLPPVGMTEPLARQSKSWSIANLSFAHPPMMPDGTSAEGAMALPTPAPMSGPLFANVADMPVKSLVGHAEVGLSRLTGLAALVHRHRHLKYVAASGLLVVLVIAVILLSWQGDNGKGGSHVAEIEKKARAAALAADPPSLPRDEPAVAPAPAPEREPSKPHSPVHTNTSKRPAAPRPASPIAKPAPVEDPFSPPAGMMRSAEKPIPLAAIQGKRATAGASEPRAISQAQISEVVRKKENQAGLKTCYERALKRDGRLRTGRLDITVSIGPMGTVQRVQVHGSADFMVIDKCLKEAIRHWRFPGNSEEYATSFPLILQGG